MTTDKYIIHLVRCTLKNEQPLEKPEYLLWEDVFRLAENHMIANMVWYSVNRLENIPEPELWKKWTELKNKALVRDIIQRNECGKILMSFEKEKIRCMAVKGIFLKKLYPKSDYRTMSDIDILTDNENTHRTENIMQSLGYTYRNAGVTNHDVYFKAPVMNIEIHRQLFSDKSMHSLSGYYKDAFIKAENLDNFKYVYKMTDKEFYIYTIAHFYKHYYQGGSGIRSVTDVYVLNHSIYKKLNKKSLDYTLEKLGLLDFRNQITDLSEIWFGEGKETSGLTEISDYIIGSGTYGTLSNLVNNNIKEKGKLKYFLQCAFPPLYVMKNNYPALNKMTFLLPVFYVRRWIVSLITRRSTVVFKLKSVLKRKSTGK